MIYKATIEVLIDAQSEDEALAAVAGPLNILVSNYTPQEPGTVLWQQPYRWTDWQFQGGEPAVVAMPKLEVQCSNEKLYSTGSTCPHCGFRHPPDGVCA